MSVLSTQHLMERYFEVMGAEQDFAQFYAEDVTWLMVDSGQEISGAVPIRDYILELHGRMHGGDQRPLVVGDGHAVLEGSSVSSGDGTERGLAFCLVYDVSGDRITAMRCYGTLARLMSDPD